MESRSRTERLRAIARSQVGVAGRLGRQQVGERVGGHDVAHGRFDGHHAGRACATVDQGKLAEGRPGQDGARLAPTGGLEDPDVDRALPGAQEACARMVDRNRRCGTAADQLNDAPAANRFVGAYWLGSEDSRRSCASMTRSATSWPADPATVARKSSRSMVHSRHVVRLRTVAVRGT